MISGEAEIMKLQNKIFFVGFLILIVDLFASDLTVRVAEPQQLISVNPASQIVQAGSVSTWLGNYNSQLASNNQQIAQENAKKASIVKQQVIETKAREAKQQAIAKLNAKNAEKAKRESKTQAIEASSNKSNFNYSRAQNGLSLPIQGPATREGVAPENLNIKKIDPTKHAAAAGIDFRKVGSLNEVTGKLSVVDNSELNKVYKEELIKQAQEVALAGKAKEPADLAKMVDFNNYQIKAEYEQLLAKQVREAALKRPEAISIAKETPPTKEFIAKMVQDSPTGDVNRFALAIGNEDMLKSVTTRWFSSGRAIDNSGLEFDGKKIENYYTHSTSNAFDAVIMLQQDIDVLKIQKNKEEVVNKNSNASKNFTEMITQADQAKMNMIEDIIKTSLPTKTTQGISLDRAIENSQKCTKDTHNLLIELNKNKPIDNVAIKIAKQYLEIYGYVAITLLEVQKNVVAELLKPGVESNINTLKKLKLLKSLINENILEKLKITDTGDVDQQKKILSAEELKLDEAITAEVKTLWDNSTLGPDHLKNATKLVIESLQVELVGDPKKNQDPIFKLKKQIQEILDSKTTDVTTYLTLQKNMNEVYKIIEQKSPTSRTEIDNEIFKLKPIIDRLINKNAEIDNVFKELQKHIRLRNKVDKESFWAENKASNITGFTINKALADLKDSSKTLDQTLEAFKKNLNAADQALFVKDISKEDFTDLLLRLQNEEITLNQDTYLYQGLDAAHSVTVKPVKIAASYVGNKAQDMYNNYVKNTMSGTPEGAQAQADMNKATKKAIDVMNDPSSTTVDKQNALHTVVRVMYSTAGFIASVCGLVAVALGVFIAANPQLTLILIKTLFGMQEAQNNQDSTSDEKKKQQLELMQAMLKDVVTVVVADQTGADVTAVQSGDLQAIATSAVFNQAISYIDPSAQKSSPDPSDSMSNINKVKVKHKKSAQKKEDKNSAIQSKMRPVADTVPTNSETPSNSSGLPNSSNLPDLSYEDYNY